MSDQPHPPKDYATPKERLADQDWADVAKHGIKGLTPASSGWVLALVLMFLGMTIINYFNVSRQADSINSYLENQSKEWAKIEEHRAEEMRRCQQAYNELAKEAMRQRGEAAEEAGDYAEQLRRSKGQ